MNINEILKDNVLRVKENQTQKPLPEGFTEWMMYIRSVKRVADEKAAADFKEKLLKKGIITQ